MTEPPDYYRETIKTFLLEIKIEPNCLKTLRQAITIEIFQQETVRKRVNFSYQDYNFGIIQNLIRKTSTSIWLMPLKPHRFWT